MRLSFALALVLALLSPFVVATSNGGSDLALAAHWAPTWYQDTDSSNYKAEYITRFDFDGVVNARGGGVHD